MKPFEYAAPGSVRAAIGLLSDAWGKTEILAGGTDLITCLKQNLTTPERVVSLKNIPALKGIEETGGMLRIGSMTTLAELAGNPLVKKHFPSLATSAEAVGSPQLMTMGTVGGDLCQRPRCWFYRNGLGLFGQQEGLSLVREGDNRYHAIFGDEGPALFVSASSFGPAFIALGANVTVEGPGGSRQIPAADFFQTPKTEHERETILKPNDVLTLIEIPLRGWKNATYEIRHRQGLDWPYVTATAAWKEEGGVISDGRVVLGHVAPVPWLASKAGATLKGAKINEALAAQCGEAAISGAKPLSENGYKLQLVKTAVKRAVLAAAQA